MKNKFRVFCLVLVFMLINTACAKRRLEQLETKRQARILSSEEFDINSDIFYPDNIDKFSIEEYLAWYKNLEKPPQLQLPQPENPKALTNQEMVNDFNYVFNELKANYPFFNVLKREYNIDFLGNYNKYLKRIKKANTDQEFIDEMTGIMGELNNFHARIADGKYVDNILRYYKDKRSSPSIYYEFLNLNKQTVRNRYGLNGYQVSSKDDINSRLAMSFFKQEEGANLTLDTSKENIAILRINEMPDSTKFAEDEKVIRELLRNKHLYKTLIIDIRENYGGNMQYRQEFLLPMLLKSQKTVTNHLFFKDSDRSKLMLSDETLNVQVLKNVDISAIHLEHADDLKDFTYYIRDVITIDPNENEKNFGFDGNIYLLVDKAVFSAAEGMASFMKHSKSATLVGEQTGGDGITLGVINDVMPNSGIVFTYTNTLGYAPDGTIDEEKRTMPDIQSTSYRNSIETIEEIEEGNF